MYINNLAIPTTVYIYWNKHQQYFYINTHLSSCNYIFTFTYLINGNMHVESNTINKNTYTKKYNYLQSMKTCHVLNPLHYDLQTMCDVLAYNS